jgi:hypothetical protein
VDILDVTSLVPGEVAAAMPEKLLVTVGVNVVDVVVLEDVVVVVNDVVVVDNDVVVEVSEEEPTDNCQTVIQ